MSKMQVVLEERPLTFLPVEDAVISRGPWRGLPHWGGSATALLLGLALVKVLLQFAGIRHYGFFRDELYYMSCGRHLAWGYIDQPPLIAAFAWFEAHVFGTSIVALRLLPVLSGGAVVFLTGILARELGGDVYAQCLAAVSALFAPAFLAFDSFFSMNAFEPLFWVACTIIALRIVGGASPRWWLAFGVLAGIALENKHTMLVFGFALVVGLLLSGEARVFRSKWIWIGGLVALAIFLPNVIWEARHGWPQIEVVRNAQRYKNIPISALDFLGDQVAFLNPLALPVWLGGLAWLLFTREGRPFRFLGWCYLTVLAVFLFLNGKSYYVLPAYPLILAAGGVAIERFAESPARKWVRVSLPAAIVVGGLVMAPFGVPFLPIGTFLRYDRIVPAGKIAKTERDAKSVQLPQLYADMFGWHNIATTVSQVYDSLPPDERSSCGILAGNYGEAGAIDYYGPSLGLPAALSGHNSYYDWGPRSYSGACMIVFGERSSEYIKLWGNVRVAAVIHSAHAMPNERSIPIYICHKPIAPLKDLWPHFKMII
ncbi:MAG: glycosyltransferase family 39 protein [Candidatus Acidiferrales bacterium]